MVAFEVLPCFEWHVCRYLGGFCYHLAKPTLVKRNELQVCGRDELCNLWYNPYGGATWLPMGVSSITLGPLDAPLAVQLWADRNMLGA